MLHLIINPFQKIYSFYKRKIKPGFVAGEDGLVLDIGSGDKPFWRGDVFVDKLDMTNVQRATSDTVTDLGKFVDSDVSSMPFGDKEFSFSYCTHLLEHVTNPTQVLTEIMRVSKSGYIEVPNALLEQNYPHPAHLWFIYLCEGELVFVRKPKFLQEIIQKNNQNFDTFKKNSQIMEDFFIGFYWKDVIKFRVIEDFLEESEKFMPVDEENQDKNVNVAKSSQNYYLKVIKMVRKKFYKTK